MTALMMCSGDSGEINTSLPLETPARRGFSISYMGKTLLSRIDPVTQGERAAADISVKERTLYLCPSPLYGYGLSVLLDRLRELPAQSSAILCIEADENLFEISRKALKAILPNLNHATCPPTGRATQRREGINIDFESQLCAFAPLRDEFEVIAFVKKNWGERFFSRVETIHLTGGWQLFPERYASIETTLRREIAAEWSNAMTLIKLGRLYSRNLIRNLALLAKSHDAAALDFGSSPVLALGAGTSLDSFLDELSRCQGERRFKIICADSCLPALLERGIIPDIAVILESQHWNLRAFSGLRGQKIDAALDLSALPPSANVLAGKRFFFATPWTTLALFARLNEAGLLPKTFPPLGSVGLNVVALALASGSGLVFTAGLDFSYTLDAYHARSAAGHNDLLIKQNRFKGIFNTAAAFREGSFVAASKTGKPLRSDPAMRNYRDLFEQCFGGNKRLFDVGGTGLPLGIKTVSPAEAFTVLYDGAKKAAEKDTTQIAAQKKITAEKLKQFIQKEIDILKTLKEMLTGETAPDNKYLEELLDAADYLWAHFPDCAAAGRRRPSCTDLNFLKRVRVEIEPFMKLWLSNTNLPKGM